MPYISNKTIEEVKNIDLLTYLRKENPFDLVPQGKGEYRLKSHDSLKISNGLWHWFSRGIGGKSALDYLVKVEGLSFMDAIKKLSGDQADLTTASPPAKRPAEKEKRTLILPSKHENADRVFQYLTRDRSIDPEIVKRLIQTEAIYESRYTEPKSKVAYVNAVFTGRDEQGAVRQASIRGIDSRYKGEAAGSDKSYSFSVSPEKSDTVHIYESAVDLMSYLTLLKGHGKQVYKDHHISLAGIYKPKQDAVRHLPLALKRFLEINPSVRKAILHLDNDPPGRLSAAALIGILTKAGIIAIDSPPGTGKDVNDYLRREIRHKQMECRTR